MNRRERRAAAKGGRGTGAASADIAALLQDGLGRHQAGRLDEAAARYRQALKQDPENPDALHLLGLIEHQRGASARAVELIGRALARDPKSAVYHGNMGAALRALGRAADALDHIRRAVALDPGDVEMRVRLGDALDASGQTAAAGDAYREALRRDPDSADAHGALAALLARTGDAAGAVQHAARALEIEPVSPVAHNNLAGALIAARRHDEAVATLRKAVALAPGYAEAWINLGVLLRTLQRPSESEEALRRGLALKPGDANGWETLGLALEDQDRLEEAIEMFGRSIAADPRRPNAYNNMGLSCRRMGRRDDAIRCYGDALRADPGFDHAAANRALLLLAAGRFADGWKDFRRRESIKLVRDRLVQDALPGDLAGKRIMVWRDQGLGDEIFFLRFVRRLKQRAPWIAYRAQPKIAPLVARLDFIDLAIEEGRDADPTDVDMIVSAGDLPLLTGMACAADIPESIALDPLPARVAEMRVRLAAAGPPPWIGVTWRAGVQEQNRLSKVAPQDALAQAVGGARATLIALQRNPDPGEIDRFAAIAGRPLADFTALNDDLDGMLALLGLLDDYVCVSNTNVHLRAARGRTCRVLVPFPADYRWMDAGDESPWFPGTRVYRETRADGWRLALEGLAADLAAAFPAAGAAST